jgi:hypothetical protein
MNYFSKFFRACEIFIVEISTSRRGDNKKVPKNLNHMYLYYVGDSNIINKCFYNIHIFFILFFQKIWSSQIAFKLELQPMTKFGNTLTGSNFRKKI